MTATEDLGPFADLMLVAIVLGQISWIGVESGKNMSNSWSVVKRMVI